MSAPDVHPVHKPHGGGVQWLELVLSVSAIVTSLVSVYIAIQHGKVMEKLVAANSLPYVQIVSGNATDDKFDTRPAVFMGLDNVGVGPAKVGSLQMTTPDGRHLHTLADMVDACCTPEEARSLRESYITYDLKRYFIPARQLQHLFMIRRTPGNDVAWNKLDRLRQSLRVTTCYCSVFDECYLTDAATGSPAPVRTCSAEAATEFRPTF